MQTNIADGRYHAPLVLSSAYAAPYGTTLKQMDEHVDSGSNPEEMAMAIYTIINDKNRNYIIKWVPSCKSSPSF